MLLIRLCWVYSVDTKGKDHRFLDIQTEENCHVWDFQDHFSNQNRSLINKSTRNQQILLCQKSEKNLHSRLKIYNFR